MHTFNPKEAILNTFSQKNLSFIVFCLALLVKVGVWADVGGTLIPFYIYPNPSEIQPLLDAKLAHPNVAMRVILDPIMGQDQYRIQSM